MKGLKVLVGLCCVFCLSLAIAAPAKAQFGSGLASGLIAGDDDLANAIILGRMLDGRTNGDFAGGFALGRFLSPVEQHLFNQRRALERQRLRDLERELRLERAVQRRRNFDHELAIQRELLRRELRRRGIDCD